MSAGSSPRAKPSDAASRLRESAQNGLCQNDAATQVASSLEYELEMSPLAPKVYAFFGKASSELAVAVGRSLYSKQPRPVVCLDAAKSSSLGLEEGKRQMRDAISQGIANWGHDTMVVLHGCQSLRGDRVRFFDAVLELFNGERTYMVHDGKTISAASVIFILLFEDDSVVEKGGSWQQQLQQWWAYSGQEFTPGAAVGRIGYGIVLEPPSGTALITSNVCGALSASDGVPLPGKTGIAAVIAVALLYCAIFVARTLCGSKKAPVVKAPKGKSKGEEGKGGATKRTVQKEVHVTSDTASQTKLRRRSGESATKIALEPVESAQTGTSGDVQYSLRSRSRKSK